MVLTKQESRAGFRWELFPLKTRDFSHLDVQLRGYEMGPSPIITRKFRWDQEPTHVPRIAASNSRKTPSTFHLRAQRNAFRRRDAFDRKIRILSDLPLRKRLKTVARII